MLVFVDFGWFVYEVVMMSGVGFGGVFVVIFVMLM